MPHVTIHHLVREMSAGEIGALSDAIVAVVAEGFRVDPGVVTVSLSPTAEEDWRSVLERADAEGVLVRRPGYPTDARVPRGGTS